MRRLSPRALRLLTYYFGHGLSLSQSARAAGFRGRSTSSLCNTAKRIVDRFYEDPQKIFAQMRKFQVEVDLTRLRRLLKGEKG